MTELRTTSDVIDALGGPTEVAGLVGGTVQRVWNWRRAKTFPVGADEVLKPILRKRGLCASDAVWGRPRPWVPSTRRDAAGERV
jgi:hypothetical protein